MATAKATLKSAHNRAEEVTRAIDRAVSKIIILHPFFAMVLLRLPIIEDVTCQTAWTDGQRIGYNPDFVLSLSHDELVGVMVHEVLHVTALHPWRRQAREPKEWNIACDQEVNHLVSSSGFVLPSGAIPGVPDKAAEELYQQRSGGGGGGTKPPPKGGSAGKPPKGGKGQQPQPPQQGQQPPPPPQSDDPGGTGEVRDAKTADGNALTDAERNKQVQDIKRIVETAKRMAKKAGKFPAGLERFVDEVLEPKIPWREILNRFVDSTARNDYNWSRPSRRYMSAGLILPSLSSPAFGQVVIAPDASGSMGREQLIEVASEALGALEVYAQNGQQPELTVAWFDTEVYPQVITAPEDIDPKGGGGTNFANVFKWLVDDHEAATPRAIIMLTDGECNSFGEDPGIPVLWILTETNHDFDPPFGELTSILNEN